MDWLLREFRLLVNESIRICLKDDIRSRAGLVRAAYQDLSRRHLVYKQHLPSAFEVALSVLKAHRRRLKRGKRSLIPYMRKLMLKAENQAYRLDRETGQLRIPIRGTEGVQLSLSISHWHLSFLGDLSWQLGSLTVVPGKIIIVVRKQVTESYKPRGAIALDTNEDSMDGVFASGEAVVPTILPFDSVRQIQSTHFRRRRKLARKKAYDKRVQRILLNREGRRERNRVRQRLHRVSKRLVSFAKVRGAAIVLEKLSLRGAGGRSHRVNRRLSSWPRGESIARSSTKPLLRACPSSKSIPRGHRRPAQCVALGAEIGWARCSCA